MPLSWEISSHLATTAGFLLAALLIAHIVRQRRPPTATIAWLLVIVLIPYIGVPLYLMLGGRKMRLRAGRKARIMMAKTALPPADLRPLERLFFRYGIPPATNDNGLTLYQTGEESYAALVALIEAATRSIHISIFILHPDEVGLDIIARLARRAAEGIEVRLLLDGVGSMHTRRRFLAPLAAAGGRYAFFMPVLHVPFRGRSNLRNHRKTVIVDDRRVLAGGANIAVEYMGPAPHPDRWRDLTFALEGSAVLRYAELFRSDWRFASGELIAASQVREPGGGGVATVQVVPSGPDVPGDPLYDALLTATFSARRRLWVVTPYFIPDEALCRALVLAAHRGVDVRLVVPQRSNHRLADMAGRSYLREVRAEGGTVLFYSGMLHGKAVLIDDELAILGSANIDMRSLLLNYEAGLFVYSEAEIRAVEQWMQALAQGASSRLTNVKAMGEIMEGLARLFAPQL